MGKYCETDAQNSEKVMNASYLQPRLGDAEFKNMDAFEVVRQVGEIREHQRRKFNFPGFGEWYPKIYSERR